METVKDTLYIIRDQFEAYVWFAPLILEAVCLLRGQKLLQGCGYLRKCIRLSLAGIGCLFLAFFIKDFSLSRWFSALPYGYALHLAVKLLLAMALVWLGVLALKRFGRLWENEKTAGFVGRNKWGLLLFAMLMVPTLWANDFLEPYVNGWYVVDYSMGLGSRFFIGSLCRLLFGSFITETETRTFIWVTELLISVCLAYMGNRVCLRAEPETRPAAAFVTLCFLCSPFSVEALFKHPNFGRLEIYTLLLCLAAVLLFHRLKSTWLKYGLVAVVGCVCNAIYQGFLFLYLPLLLMPMIREIFGEAQRPLRRLGAAAAACLPIGASFLAFQFFSFVNFSSAEEMMQALRERTSLTLTGEATLGALNYELFAPFSTTLKNMTLPFLLGNERPVDALALFAILMLPVIILTSALYHSCFAQLRARHVSKWKTPYPYFLLTLLVVLPQYVLNCDWGRWTIALGTDLFFGILYLLYTGSGEMVEAMRRLTAFLKKRPALAVVMLAYLAGLGYVGLSVELPAVTYLKRLL